MRCLSSGDFICGGGGGASCRVQMFVDGDFADLRDAKVLHHLLKRHVLGVSVKASPVSFGQLFKVLWLLILLCLLWLQRLRHQEVISGFLMALLLLIVQYS